MLDRERVFGKRATILLHSHDVLFFIMIPSMCGTDVVEAGQRGRSNNDSV